ncbi:dehydrogenase E1 component subunit alpha/beta [Roseiterribacter gracilis]|uniref:2-oxoglutarate dehydrogenase E1 component n=1 Tax=Roseiterribacter gracilis TaxID=2812848 RepID=A0A8S8XCX8_9PROT|nr:MFS transporter [Rhodospirillales bacterium TMPK1]
MDPAELVHRRFLDSVAAANFPAPLSEVSLDEAGLTAPQLVELFQSQVTSRQLDRTARALQARGEGFYTIGSSGHEGNAAIAAAFRVGDMAFLHYRDAAFQIQRATKLPGETAIWDMLLSFAASSDDPISGGRHKVLGSKRLFIPPQTSTIASHLPKAVGAAYSIGTARKLDLHDRVLADDAVVLCSFGDASANHSTALGAINSASWAAYQGVPMPIVFICEDNGIGISTRTPRDWIAASFSTRPALAYLRCNGLDLLDTFRTARTAEMVARKRRQPVFLHMDCVRLYGHAGSDVQATYLSKEEIARCDAGDPLLHTAALLARNGILTPSAILELYEDVGRTVARVAEEAIKRPKLTNAADVMQSIVPPARAATASRAAVDREALFGAEIAAMEKPQHMAKLINWALTDLMIEHKNIVLAGEDIGPKGGVYNVTAKLHARFGAARVINTLLDEQTILGLGLGLAHNGILPITEIQFLAYLHNAEDQLRGEAATLSFFSDGQFTNPMIVRVAGLGYQKGFGGHFHNDNSLAVLRDVPGLVIACPSNGKDAAAMLRECARLAAVEQRVVVFVEPIALYMTRDLHDDKDGLWTFPYEPHATLALGSVGQHGEGTDLAIVTYGNGTYLSLQAQRILEQQHGIAARVVDLRWLAPLDPAAILRAVADSKRVLIVDECRITGSQSEALMAMFAEHAPQLSATRIAALDCFIPLGRAATLPLPSRDSIVEAAREAIAPRRMARAR